MSLMREASMEGSEKGPGGGILGEDRNEMRVR